MTAPASVVSVIVPAYNAADTIDETLRSVRTQTYPHLDIIVIDDGSTDLTRAIVERHAAQDARIRVYSQPNAGAAIARNRGIALAKGELIAPIDADDLWRPDKIARQVEIMDRDDGRIGLVYTWFAAIDEEGRVTSLAHCPTDEGDVLAQMCRGNLVGNGSSALMRKSVVLEVGGYDDSRPQFCEDLRLYFLIAEKYDFAVVRDHLTGYRQRNASVSNDVLSMLRYYDLVAAEFKPKYPRYAHEFHVGRNYMIGWLFSKALKAGKLRAAAMLVLKAFFHDPYFMSEQLLRLPRRAFSLVLATSSLPYFI